MKLTINGAEHVVEAAPDMPLLWVLRDLLGLTGTKFGCGLAQCGACTVHLGGAPLRSCVTPVSAAAGKAITTIEGLSPDGGHPVQLAWAELDVVQCGYCQSGQIMSAAALLAAKPVPTDADIRRDDGEHLPLRHLSAHPRRRTPRSRPGEGRRVMKAVTPPSRREFLKTSALISGGLVIGFVVPSAKRFAAAQAPRAGRSFAPNAFVRVGSDDRVT